MESFDTCKVCQCQRVSLCNRKHIHCARCGYLDITNTSTRLIENECQEKAQPTPHVLTGDHVSSPLSGFIILH